MSWIRNVLGALAPGLLFGLCSACVTAAALAALGGARGRLDVLAHFAPFWLVGAVAAGGYTFAAPRALKPVFGGLGLAGLLACLFLMAPEYLRAIPHAPKNAPNQIKVIQLNAWRNNVDFAGTARWLAAQKADVIIMEEAEPPLVAEVEAVTGLHLTCRRCGISIYTRSEPVAQFKLQRTKHRPTRKVRPPLAFATIKVAGRDVTVVGTHTVWPTEPAWQRGQGDTIAEVLSSLPGSTTILAGDFNSTPWSHGRRLEDRRFGLTRITRGLFSWPARSVLSPEAAVPFPVLPIDHIYVGDAFKVVSVTRGPRLGSDHYPVVAVLSLQP